MHKHNKSYKLASILVLWSFILFPEAYAENAPRDPTQPPSYSDDIATEIPNSDIKITAIFVGKDRKIVMIGNHSFTIGEKVSGLIITAIDANGITLKNGDGSELRVIMPYSTIKQSTTNKEETQ